MRTKDLGNDSILKLVIALAVPAMIAQLVNVLYSIVDRMFVGQIPLIGNDALAAIGVCGPIVTLLSSFGTLVGIGGSILMSMKMGQKKTEEAKELLFNSFVMLVGISLALTVIFLLSKEHLILWFGGSEQLFDLADTYFTIYTAGTFFALLAMGLNSFITCQGYSKVAMCSVFIGAGSNIILDALFILYFNWGIAGAAYATVIAQVFSAIFACVFLCKFSQIKIQVCPLSLEMMKRILRQGFSPFLIIASDSIIIIVMNTVLQKYGGEQMGNQLISAVTVAQSCFLLITGPLIGITSGTQTILSFNFGAKNKERIVSAFRTILVMSVMFCTTMFIVFELFADAFVLLFTNDPTIQPLAVKAIRIFVSAVIPMAVQYEVVDALTALSHVKVALALSLNRKVTFAIITIVIPIFFSAEAVFFAEPMVDVMACIVSSIVFYKEFPRFMAMHGMPIK